jgi:hypothetical protein
MLATLLAQPLGDPAARSAAWRQIVDVLAQGHGYRPEDRLVDAPRKIDAYNLLRTLRPEIPMTDRIDVARSLSGRRLPPDLVALFAEEPASVASPVLGEARLGAEEWIALLPTLSPMARGLLRHRRDLPREVVQALDAFGTSDFVISASPEIIFEHEIAPLAMAPDPEPLPEPKPDPPQPVDGERQIKDLLRRIESFRARVAERRADASVEGPGEIGSIEEFRFETGVDGIILWVDGAPRGALVGETIAVAGNGDHGVDGHAAGAYRRRAPFRDARLSISADGPVHGEWRISGVPFFEPSDGRFTGYRGTARRPRADETAKPVGEGGGLFGTGIEGDSLRQLVHELRTPLNAIVGFSEMIEHQYMGPAASGYRHKAADIVAQGKRMLAAVDDLDMAARVESRRIAADQGSIDASAMLQRLHADYLPVASDRGVDLAFRIAAKLPPIAGDPVAVERMFTRLLAATISLAEDGEQVLVELNRERDLGGALTLSVARPRVLAGREERVLLDPGYNPEGDWPEAPVLGLGFALRLVRNLAVAAGGRLDIEDNRFVLILPPRRDSAQTGETGA